MCQITVDQIKHFRELTGYKINDCKEALTACDGNEEQAKKYILNKWKNKVENW